MLLRGSGERATASGGLPWRAKHPACSGGAPFMHHCPVHALAASPSGHHTGDATGQALC